MHTCRHAHPLACRYAFTDWIPVIKYQNDPRRKNPYFWWRISGVVTKRRRHFARALNDETRSQGNLGSPGETESKWEGKRTERTGGKRITASGLGSGVGHSSPREELPCWSTGCLLLFTGQPLKNVLS